MATGQLTLQDILGAPNLLGLIQTTLSGVPNPFPDEFYALDKQVLGNQGVYFPVDGTRTTASTTAYGGTPRSVQQRSLGSKPIVLMHSYEEMNLDPLIYQSLFNYDNLSVQKMGAAEVARQIREFKFRLSNLRIASMVTTLFSGKIAFNGKGDFLPNTSGAATTIDFQIPTNSGSASVGVPSNIGVAVDPLGTGTAIAGSAAGAWNNPATDINKQMTALKQAAIFLTGYPLAYAFYGRNIPSIIAGNPSTQNYMARNTVMYMGGPPSNPGYIQTGEVPDGTLGVKWRPAYQAFFEDSAGVKQPLVADNQILFCPEPSLQWIGTLEGSYVIPRDPWKKLPDGPGNAMDNMDMVYGMFAYSVPTLKPPTATFCVGDTFIPVLKNPLCPMIPTVA